MLCAQCCAHSAELACPCPPCMLCMQSACAVNVAASAMTCACATGHMLVASATGCHANSSATSQTRLRRFVQGMWRPGDMAVIVYQHVAFMLIKINCLSVTGWYSKSGLVNRTDRHGHPPRHDGSAYGHDAVRDADDDGSHADESGSKVREMPSCVRGALGQPKQRRWRVEFAGCVAGSWRWLLACDRRRSAQPPALEAGASQPAHDPRAPLHSFPDRSGAVVLDHQRERTLVDAIDPRADPARLLAIRGWIGGIEGGFVENAQSLEEIRDGLTQLYPDMDASRLTALMRDGMATAYLAGRFEVQQER